MRWRPRAPKFLLAIPGFVWYGFFYAIPVLFVVINSFGYKPGVNQKGSVRLDRLSFDNYRDIWTPQFRRVFSNTMVIAGTATVLCIVVGLPVAYYIATKAGPKMKALLLVLVIVPFWMSFFVRTSAWKIVFAKTGFLNNFLIDWSVIESPIDVIGTKGAVLLALVYNYLPLMIFPLFVALDRLDPTQREASKDLFASRLKTFTQITLPLAAPGIVAGVVLVFVPLAGDYITANVLGGADGNMPGNLVATQFLQSQNPPLGAAIAVILIFSILAALGLSFVIARLLRLAFNVDRAFGMVATVLVLIAGGMFVLKPSGRSFVYSVVAIAAVGGAVWLGANASPKVSTAMLWAWSALVMVFLYLPIVFVVAHSFNDNKALEVWAGFSTRWYGEMWDNSLLTGSVKSSFEAAAVAAIISVILGTLAGISLARRSGKWTVGFMAVLLLVLTTPEIVDATGMQLQFVSFGGVFREGLVPLWIGQSIFSAAVVTLIVRARMQGMDESLEQAANDLFATPFTAFRQITLPLIAPAVLAGGLLAFTFALDNVIISDFVKAPGTNTFPTYVLGQVKTVRKPDIAAMATLLLGITLLVLFAAAGILRRSGDDSSKVAATLTGGG
jgi:spermidine/putrescine transport system permease protein